LVPGAGRGCGAALIGDRVAGARVTPISGFSAWDGAAGRGHGFWRVTTGAGSICAAVAGAGGGGAGGGIGALGPVGGTLVGVGWALVGAGLGVVDACGATVDSSAPVAGLRTASRTPPTTMAATAAAASPVTTCLVRYHGRGL
jgi:hypothetical protein